jgi:aminoglycoside phosphotransferase family enzyme/predicted kinase
MHRAKTPTTPLDTRLIDALMMPAAFEYPVSSVDLIETHISWLILTDDYVYKIKKPITLDFLDFGGLERRKFFCEEEVRLNQPWAPDIYLDVVPIGLDKGQPRFGAEGTPIEYAVRMRRFNDEMRLDVQLERGALSVADMKELGRNIAARHMAAERVDESQREKVVTLAKEFIWDNFVALEGFADETQLKVLRDWTTQELQTVDQLLWKRFDDGYVRDCHGDLHLGNLVRLPGGITTFDCIEFNTDLRHIDVAADIAFLIMDLVERGRRDLAAHFLNRYLECTGDYGSVSLLSLYFVYRCLVRAKVAAIRSQERESDSKRDADLAEMRRYCDMACRQIVSRVPILIIMSGLSGSGKTRLSGQLMAAMPAIRVRSDLERKRMFGLRETEQSDSDVDSGIYTREVSDRVYSHLCETAAMILDAGHHVILDAAFLRASDRAMAIGVAGNREMPCVLVAVEAPVDVLRQRVQSRASKATDASEAGLEVLEHQLVTAEPMTDAEEAITILCDTSAEIDIDKLTGRIRKQR